jgi:hypothetical protein
MKTCELRVKKSADNINDATLLENDQNKSDINMYQKAKKNAIKTFNTALEVLQFGDSDEDEGDYIVSCSKLDEFYEKYYPRKAGGRESYSFTKDDVFEAYIPEGMEILQDKRGCFDTLVKNWLMPMLQPREIRFKVTQLAHEIGLGPSLYLIT